MKRYKILSVLLILLTVGFIWGQSLLSVEASTRESARVTELLRPVLELFFDGDAVTGDTLRKPAHFIEFAVLGAVLSAFLTAGEHGKRLRKRVLLCCNLALYTALVDETVQLFSGRGARIPDVWLDFAGAVTGILLVAWLARAISKKKKNTGETVGP